MIKIFLVEDEKIIREGIKREIPWDKHGLELIGEAADGELAYPLIQQTRPDILLTDIRMPFMDGLELAELVKKVMPDIRIIFLSGYDDFEYAKRAIHIGASDYLLKPISSAQLLMALEQMSEQIIQMRNDQEYVEQFKREFAEQKLWERERLFDEIIKGGSNLSELLSKAQSYGVELTASAYNIVLFQFQNPSQRVEVTTKINEAYQQIKDLYSQNTMIICFDRLLDGLAFIVKQNAAETLMQSVEGLIDTLKYLASTEHQLQYFGAVGIATNRFSEIHDSYCAAGKAFAYRFMTERSEILYAEQLAKREVITGIDGDLQQLDVSGLDKKIVENFLKQSSLESCDYFIDDYIESFENNINSLIFRQYIMMDIYVVAVQYLKQIGITDLVIEESLGGIDQVIRSIHSIDAVRMQMKNVLKQALLLRDSISQKRYTQLLAQAKHFIEDNFDNESISLSIVAAEVNLSASHFSAIFSQEEEMTFVEYLTAVRMECARQLLRTSDLRTSEIAYRVGYKDPHYFSYLFKKTQGVTPKAYRGGKYEQ